MAKVNEVVNKKVLNFEDVKSALHNFRSDFKILQEKFDLSQTLKIHIICDHYKEYLLETEKSLLHASDEMTESVHSKFRLFEEAHGYKVNLKGSDSHRDNQHKSVVHFNCLNIGDP